MTVRGVGESFPDDPTILRKCSQEISWDNPCHFGGTLLAACRSGASHTIACRARLARSCRKAIPWSRSKWGVCCRWHHPPPRPQARSQACHTAAPHGTGFLMIRCVDDGGLSSTVRALRGVTLQLVPTLMLSRGRCGRVLG